MHKNGIIKIINPLDHKDDNDPKFQTKKWHIINDQNNGQHGIGDSNNSTIKFSIEILKAFICDYSDAYILLIGNITVVGGDDNTRLAFKNCHPFTRSVVHLNDEHVNTCENLDIITNMYNLTEYSDNYDDSTASLCQLKRQEQYKTNLGLDAVATNNSSSFNYK